MTEMLEPKRWQAYSTEELTHTYDEASANKRDNGSKYIEDCGTVVNVEATPSLMSQSARTSKAQQLPEEKHDRSQQTQ
jgi:hypothetical protein